MQDYDERLSIGMAIRSTVACLPEGWSIQVDIIRGHSEVTLFPPNCETTDIRYFDDPSRLLSQHLRDALDYAVKQANEETP